MNYCEACVYGRGKHAEWCEAPPLRIMLAVALAERARREAADRAERLACYFWVTGLTPRT